VTSDYPKIRFLDLALFNALVVVWWLELGLRFPVFAAIRLEFVLAALVTALALMRTRPPEKRSLPGIRGIGSNADVAVCIIVMLLVLGGSIPISVDVSTSQDMYVDRVAKLALLGALVSQFVVSPHTLRIYLFTNLLTFLKVGQEAFLGKVTGNMVWENQGVPRLHGATGSMFGDPNALSGKTVSAVPFIWYLFPTLQRTWVKVLVGVLIVFAINIIVFTASRTGYITVILAAVLIVLFSPNKKGRLVVFLLVASFLTVTFTPDEYKERFMSSFTGKEAEGRSADTRKDLFFDSLNTFAQHPLGIGLGCFPIWQKINQRNEQETHNLYTQLLAETGIQGFLCFFALVIVVLRKALRCRRAYLDLGVRLHALQARAPPDARNGTLDEEVRDNKLLASTSNALVVFLLVRLALGVFGHDLMEIYWWFAGGLAMALHNMRRIAEWRCAELEAAAGGPDANPAPQSRSRQPKATPALGQPS
jgi:putative inorganic carbon (HCO3(-)) transporter